MNHVQRSGVNVDMDDFRIVLDLMIVNNIITRKVTKKGESFYVNNSNDIDECTVNNDEDDGGHFNNSNISMKHYLPTFKLKLSHNLTN